MKPRFSVALALLSALTWTMALSLDADFEQVSILLMGVGMIATSAVATVGMIVTGGRWARRLALVGLAMTITAALLVPLDTIWVIGAVLTAAAGATLFHPALGMRKLPAATGPPARAVITTLVLVVAPFPYGLSANGSPVWALLALGLTAPLVAFAYSSVKPGGLLALRFVWPATAIGLAPLLATPAAIVSALLGITIAVLGWGPTVKTAFHPPREPGSVYPIPPELSPGEILEAADIDEQGRPR